MSVAIRSITGEAIVAGRYAASMSIPPEPIFCEELGVSRTVVREAVKSLIGKALGALLNTSFEISTSLKYGSKRSLHLHWAERDAVIACNPVKTEKAILVLIDAAHEDIELVLKPRRRLPKLSDPVSRPKAA